MTLYAAEASSQKTTCMVNIDKTSQAMNHHHQKKPKALIIGGSIAGTCCAHSLILAGWDVLVIEKARQPPKGSPTGAGVALHPISMELISSWTRQPELLSAISFPIAIDQDQAIGGGKIGKVLARDENFNHRAVHWADLHGILYAALPPEIFLWGHFFLSFSVSNVKKSIQVKAKVLHTEEIVEIDGDLLVAADGCLSPVRRVLLPDVKPRYSGYCAWRGVVNYSGIEDSETLKSIRTTYPELGKCLYFDLSRGSHTVLFELSDKRLNWVWFVNQPEPKLEGSSLTMNVSSDMIQSIYPEAERSLTHAMFRLVKETKEPFLNVIYDLDPLERIVWDNVVLIGDAAHPTTPHCARSTNMSVLDAAVLGMCLEKWGPENLRCALSEYQSIRLPVTSEQVLYSHRVGRIKQGLMLPDRDPFNPNQASPDECKELLLSTMPYFRYNPLPGHRSLSSP